VSSSADAGAGAAKAVVARMQVAARVEKRMAGVMVWGRATPIRASREGRESESCELAGSAWHAEAA
jgi:hypothetical protein